MPNAAEAKTWKTLRAVIFAAAVLTLAAALAANYGNPQWHWRLYAFQARNLDPQRLDPAAGYTGVWNNWEQDGRLVSTYNYRNGLRDGGYITYDEGGAPVATGQYRNGGFDGVQKIARADGYRTEIVYRDGKREGAETTWYPNGQIALQALYANDVQEGPMSAYADTGMIESVAPYANGVVEGIVQTFHPDGKLHSEEAYSNNEPNGASTFYMPDGGVYLIRNFRNGILDGTQTDFHPDGKTKMKEFGARMGELDGAWKEWDADGTLTVDEVYENGLLKMRDGEEVKPLGETEGATAPAPGGTAE